MEDLLTKYQLYCSQNGYKKSTMRTNIILFKYLFRECPDLSEAQIVSFFLKLKSTGRKNHHINKYISVLNTINTFHPLLYIPTYFKAEPAGIKSTMSDQEIESFLNLPCPTKVHTSRYGKKTICFTDPKGYIRYTMFWKICAFSGMRMGEVAHLTVDRVDFGRNVFILVETKTNTPRMVPIAPNIVQDLKAYISELETDVLFPSARGGKYKGDVIDDVDWNYNFKKRIERLGIKRKGLTPYSFRHSMCTRLLEEDVSFPKVMKIMGHKRAETTLQYEHLTTKDIQTAVLKHSLIQRSTDPENILNSLAQKVEEFNIRHDNRFFFKMTRENGALFIEIKAKH